MMSLYISAVEPCTGIPECMTPEEVRHVIQVDDQLNTLTACMINGWLTTRAELREIETILAIM